MGLRRVWAGSHDCFGAKGFSGLDKLFRAGILWSLGTAHLPVKKFV